MFTKTLLRFKQKQSLNIFYWQDVIVILNQSWPKHPFQADTSEGHGEEEASEAEEGKWWVGGCQGPPALSQHDNTKFQVMIC